MDKRILFDMHTHSDNSPDGEHSVTLMCEKAIEKGVKILAITDHCECNAYREDHYDRSSKQSFFEISKAQAVFGNRIRLLRGVELGQPTQDILAAETAVRSNDYDFVLGSLHNNAGRRDYYYLNYSEEDVDKLLDEYFAELFQLVTWGGFDSLAHLIYPIRYITGRDGIAVDLSKWREAVDEVLRLLARKGKALEINTSCLKMDPPFTMPGYDLISRFRELGGELITIGSDSHTADGIYFGIDEGRETAKRAGFEYAAVFVKRRPEMIKL